MEQKWQIEKIRDEAPYLLMIDETGIIDWISNTIAEYGEDCRTVTFMRGVIEDCEDRCDKCMAEMSKDELLDVAARIMCMCELEGEPHE